MIVYLARRFLWGASGRGWRSSVLLTAMLGIFFASAFVLVSVGILAGFQNAYRAAILNFNTHVVVTSEIGIDELEQGRIREFLDGIKIGLPHESSPYLFYETLMPTGKGMRPVILKGVDSLRMRTLYPFSFHDLGGDGAKIVGGAIVGSGVTALQPALETTSLLKILALRDKKGNPVTQFETLPVAGIFSSGLYHFDAQYILMDIEELRKRYFHSDVVNGFEIRLKDPERIGEMKDFLKQAFADDFEITTWDELNAGLLDALKLERTTFFAIALLILTIASLNIFGFNFLFFLQRKREFLILSLMGMPQEKLRRLLALLSLGVGAVATFLATLFACGVLLYLRDGAGIPLDPEVYFVAKIPVFFEFRWFLYFIIGTWALCLATSWLTGRVVLGRHMHSSNLSF